MATPLLPTTEPLPLPLPLPLPPSPPPPQNPPLPTPDNPVAPSPSPPPPPENPSPPPPSSPPSDHALPRPQPPSNNHSPPSSPPFSPSRLAIVLRSPGKPSSIPDQNPDSNNAVSALTIGSLLATTDLTVAKTAATGGGSVKRGLLAPNPWKFRKNELRKFELGLRVCALVLCVVSLTLLVADTIPGWAGDSFIRYQEYRLLPASLI